MKHQTILTGLPLQPGAPGIVAPTVLAYAEDSFVDAFLDDLRGPDRDARLAARDVFAGVDLPSLQQPVHRVFHIVVVDARCLTPGMPRLDPAKVVKAGMVMRRVRTGGEDGWMRRGDRPVGWQALPAGALSVATEFDPDARLRRARLEGRNAALLSRLDQLPGQGEMLSETVVPLFPAPPDVTKSAGRSLFYGFLPLSSAETEPEVQTDPPFATSDIEARLPSLLRTDRGDATLPPVAQDVSAAEMQRPEDHPDPETAKALRTLKSALVWLSQETGAFNDGAAPGIADALRGVALEGGAEDDLFALLELCYRAFILQEPGAPSEVAMPDAWPAPSSGTQTALVNAAFAAMSARWGTVSPMTPQFPAIAVPYRLRCFVRIDDCPGCPPRIAWSPPSPDWTIRPWFMGGDGPPRQIELPALGLDMLKSLKPNVAVKVPPELQQHMDRINLGDLMEGEHKPNPLNFGMICGFSIPIITICAFIILQIFLQLLNIIFFWLPYVRICIPFPQINTAPAPSEEDS